MSEELDQAIETGRILLERMEQVGFPTPESQSKVISRLFKQAGIAPPNLAVVDCDRAFSEAAEQAFKEGKSEKLIKQLGRIAYCGALPKLTRAADIRDFIACVTHAMALEIIPGNEGTRLLYAAQVAHMARTKRPKKRNKSSHTNTPVVAATTEESAA